MKPKNTGVGSLSLLQWIFLTQESNRDLLYCRQILYQLNYQWTCRSDTQKWPSSRSTWGDFQPFYTHTGSDTSLCVRVGNCPIAYSAKWTLGIQHHLGPHLLWKAGLEACKLHFPESIVSRHPIYIPQWHTHLRPGRERGDTDHMFPPAVVGSHIGLGRCGVLQPPLVFPLWITCLHVMGSSSSQSSRISSGFLW